MSQIDKLFDRMDDWRHFPDYQLERRADLFFSLYLPEVLELKLGLRIDERIVPEFPVHKGAIGEEGDGDRSYKIDYFALSADATTAILIELKTDATSRNTKQDRYLEAARSAELVDLLNGTVTIFRATRAKRKYYCLLDRLAKMGLLEIPQRFRVLMSGGNLRGVTEESRQVIPTAKARNVSDRRKLYIQPSKTRPEDISFEDFASVVESHEDPFSQRFAQSLIRWAELKAGRKRST